jgi:hypothetical protein
MDSSKSKQPLEIEVFFENRISSKHVITTPKDIGQSIKVFKFIDNLI